MTGFINLFLSKLKNNMKGTLMSVSDKLLLRKRAIIETVNDELKNIAKTAHYRHRCFEDSMVNLQEVIATYSFFSKSRASMYKGHLTH